MIQTKELHGMVADWLNTPVNGYLGSSYGNDLHKLLQKPISTIPANNAIKKLRVDIPIINFISENAINIYGTSYLDKYNLFLDIAGNMIEVPISAN